MFDQLYPTRPLVSALTRSLDSSSSFQHPALVTCFPLKLSRVSCPSRLPSYPLFVTQLPTCPALILRKPLSFPNLTNGYACLPFLESCSSLDLRSSLRPKHAPYSYRLIHLVSVLSCLVFVLSCLVFVLSSSCLRPVFIPVPDQFLVLSLPCSCPVLILSSSRRVPTLSCLSDLGSDSSPVASLVAPIRTWCSPFTFSPSACNISLHSLSPQYIISLSH
jgi:hypothetical protein